MSELKLQVPKSLRRGWLRWDEESSVASGIELLNLLANSLGYADLSGVSVLDIGCGCKFTQAIHDGNVPIGSYTGVDVYADMIEFLRSSVQDARFDFHHIDIHNDMYNPEGEPLSASTSLPVGNALFDVICAFSVFTHLNPEDYVAMLKVLRQYVKPDGHLFFSLFVNEETTGGHGHADHFKRLMEKLDQSQLDKHRGKLQKTINEGVPDFVDIIPEHPLRVAMYSREHAIKLVEGTGWHIDSLNDPLEQIQHYMICSPT